MYFTNVKKQICKKQATEDLIRKLNSLADIDKLTMVIVKNLLNN